jgi:hypothetical protein
MAAIWGFAEATLFFVVPDVIVGLIGLRYPRKALAAGLAAVAGACAGGAVVYLVGIEVGDDLRVVMDAIPAVDPEMLDRAREELLDRGGIAIVNGQSQGIPYKLYATEWSLQGWALATLVLWTITARAIRIVTFGVLMAVVGSVFRRRIEERPRPWLLYYVAAWMAFYVYFWLVLLPARFGSP